MVVGDQVLVVTQDFPVDFIGEWTGRKDESLKGWFVSLVTKI